MRPYYEDGAVTIYHGDAYCEIAARRCAQEVLDLPPPPAAEPPRGLLGELARDLVEDGGDR